MKKYSYEDFLEIIATLRSENGCPWDKEQTHMSLRPCMMEEAAEVMAGIRLYDETGDYTNLREELGDVLLQVVMHAQIAKEEGLFTIEDVIDEVAAKMVRRHPHVFGELKVSGSGQVLENWEEIKKKEKSGKTQPVTPLREIPAELPSLARATKVLKKADKHYEPGQDYKTCVAALETACQALKGCEPCDYSQDISKQVGDALLALAGVSRTCKLYPEQILTDRIEAIIEYYEATN